MEGWELGMIIGCSVLAVILIAIVVRYLCKGKCGGGGSGNGKNGEKQPLLDGKTTSTAAALRFDKRIEQRNSNNQHPEGAGDPHNHGGDQMGAGAFLDAQATKRINAWVDEVDKFRRDGVLVPLLGHPSSSATANSGGGGSGNSGDGGSDHNHISSNVSAGTRDSDLLGDTPDVGGLNTPRTPNNLSPRISGVDVEGQGGQSSTQGVYMGYSPKVLP